MNIYFLSCKDVDVGGGIYSYTLQKNGDLVKKSFFSCDKPMYAVIEDDELYVALRSPFNVNKNSGYFCIDKNFSNSSVIKNTGGQCACHLCVDKNDVYIVNYLSGNIVKNGNEINNRVGKSVHPLRQEMSHTHFIGKTSDNFLAVCDLGTDSLCFYDKNLSLISETKVKSGYGIRHLAFSRDGKLIYAMNELVPSISIFKYESGKAVLMDTCEILCSNDNANGAAIRISDNGQYLYASVREENIICVYRINGKGLELIQKIDCGGDSPRDFNIYSDYLFVCNEKSGNIVEFELQDGLINRKLSELKIDYPICCAI